MEFVQLTIFLLLLCFSLAFYWLKQQQQYWSKRNVKDVPNSIFYFGRTQHLANFLQNIYQRFKDSGEIFVGIFSMFSPTALMIDLDLIKNVFITDFEYFPDRGFYHNLKDDPLSGNILRMEGEPWKRLRAKLTSTFSSAKMKYMFNTVLNIGENFQHSMQILLANGAAELEMRELCARYTTDVIASVAFGLDFNTLQKPQTEFRKKCDKAFNSFNLFVENVGVKYIKLFQSLHFRAFPKDVNDFFHKIVTENIAYRENNNIKRNDFLDLLIELRNTKLENGENMLSIEEIVAQAFVFFIGGFETSSSTMTFCLFELSQNLEIQEIARKDVLDTLAKHNNELTYESLKEMKYLNKVLHETLRKYPVGPTLKRMTRKDYKIPNSEHIICENTIVVIPVYAIHHDPSIYPEPDKFDPMRFSTDAVLSRHPMAYLPFGAGPRICIAQRFGIMQTSLGLAMLLKNFRFSITDETPDKLVFDKRNIRGLSVAGGIKLKVEKI
ncbi:probable cytochrome P450 6a13 [Teleopsis dalmanni]|uniref:probable cytochrome P450 6a13 n=1 Tax=Teleopsis dalmanni TaxID=139649 RepID=UPI0018CE8203|nr:probable cytochrome P450 6a13 [Teleopsis dalmanni]